MRQDFVTWYSHSERFRAHVPFSGVGRGQPRLESNKEAETQTLWMTCLGGCGHAPRLAHQPIPDTSVTLDTSKPPSKENWPEQRPCCPHCLLCAVGPLVLPDWTSGGHPAWGQTCPGGDSDLWRPGVRRWEEPSLKVLNQRLVRGSPWGRWSESEPCSTMNMHDVEGCWQREKTGEGLEMQREKDGRLFLPGSLQLPVPNPVQPWPDKDLLFLSQALSLTTKRV